jgi:demethylmenaquinone methyltransferase/2-methoxy-6-polyprenyl-1,4-benzoquinol methylase
MNHVKPYHSSDKSKKEEVAEMFDNISSRYDFLNRFLSFGIDVSWRKKTVKEVNKTAPKHVLDMATGTGDLAIMMAQNGIPKITGADLSAGMLRVGQQKINVKELETKISLIQADSENLPFESGMFDAATVAFGVRNFENTIKGLAELHRVLKADGRLFVLEFSQPEKFPFKQVYGFYFRYILPRWGKIISGDHAAYTYLPESVKAFPYGNEFMQLAIRAGFRGGRFVPLTFGIASLYILEK